MAWSILSGSVMGLPPTGQASTTPPFPPLRHNRSIPDWIMSSKPRVKELLFILLVGELGG